MKNILRICVIMLSMCVAPLLANAQALPHESENIDYITTFGNQADKNNGDDDFVQTFFIVIPRSQDTPFFIRIFDPDPCGSIDEVKDNLSRTKFSIYGGKYAYSEPDARGIDPVGNYKSGIMLTTKTFDCSPEYDGKWFVFGPFNPKEGELVDEMDGYIFKIVTEGIKGRNGNLYRYFISKEHDRNSTVEGANAFTYKYTFRLQEKANSVAFFYPFVSKDVVSLKVHTFDFDMDGSILLYSVKKNRHKVKISSDNEWAESTHKVEEAEKSTTVNIQIVKRTDSKNDMVMYVTNQYNRPVPFFAIPIGGPPKYRYKVNLHHIRN